MAFRVPLVCRSVYRSLSVRRRVLYRTGASPRRTKKAAGGAEKLDTVQKHRDFEGKCFALAYPPEHYFNTHKVVIKLQSLGK